MRVVLLCPLNFSLPPFHPLFLTSTIPSPPCSREVPPFAAFGISSPKRAASVFFGISPLIQITHNYYTLLRYVILYYLLYIIIYHTYLLDLTGRKSATRYGFDVHYGYARPD